MGFGYGNSWLHAREIGRTCPECGERLHLVKSKDTGRYSWLHDLTNVSICHIETGGTIPIDEDEVTTIMREAEERGVPVHFTTGRKKRVRCVETGETFDSIADAARRTGCLKPSLSSALKRGGTCAKCHWEFY